jgi:hypothetical protein
MADDQTKILPVATALSVLCPNNRWSIQADDLSTLEWSDDPEARPTDEAINAKAQELLDAAPLRRLRQLRDERMREVDWVTLRAARTGEPVPQEWQDYMQALADITDQVGNATLSGRQIFGVTWPERPDGKPAGNPRASRGMFGL